MRVTLILISASVLVTGCSVLDNVRLASFGNTYDPTLIYLDGMKPMVIGRNEDLDEYACMNGPLYCELFASSWECECQGAMSFVR